MTDYEYYLTWQVLREVYKNDGVEDWLLQGPEGTELALKINQASGWQVCRPHPDGWAINHESLAHWLSDRFRECINPDADYHLGALFDSL